jgi:hypothetical protein
MCIPVDSLLWALVSRIRDDGYEATQRDVQALLGSGCSAARAREVLEREAALHPEAPFESALRFLR